MSSCRFKAVLLLLLLAAPLVAGERRRVMVETDAGGDPDDEQSFVRFLLYANEWDVEGIIANRPVARPQENLNSQRTGLGIVRQLLRAYGKVYPRLKENAPGYPAEEALTARTVSGYADSDAGVKLILAAADRDDPRPIWFMNWGTDRGSAPSSLKRALDRVLDERGPAGYAAFKNKFLLYSADRFEAHSTRIPPLWRICIEQERTVMEGDRWYHRFSPLTATAGGFNLERDVRTNHGPLGTLYPTNTNVPQKEGDSGFFLYLVPTGMNDPMHPEWGSWAGRFGVQDDQSPQVPTYFAPNVRDRWDGTISRDNTLRRWAVDLQNDFRARMDWCVQPFQKANHRPTAVANGDTSGAILTLQVRGDDGIKLSAAGSSDPDDDELVYEWSTYPEAGTYDGNYAVSDVATRETSLHVPPDAGGRELHVILAVRDRGMPRLASYRRIILRVRTEK